ncbi:response regulator [Brevirhabdus sp.]|uniref:response regulator n=1 Tax=Brevirhabdus sp. TaxID=2004514 RepID=UPI0040584462
MKLDIESIFSAVPSPYVLLDSDLRIVWANDAYLGVTGRARETLIGRLLMEAFPADPDSVSDQMLKGSFDRVLRTCATDHLPLIPYPIEGADGVVSEKFWSATHTPILDGAGRVQYILQNTNDVTEIYDGVALSSAQQVTHAGLMKRAEEVSLKNLELDNLSLFFRTIFDQAPSAISVTMGPEHRFQFVNRAHSDINGGRPLQGKTVREAFPEIEGQGFFEVLDRVFRSGEPVTQLGAPVSLQQPDGRMLDLFFDLAYQPLRDRATGEVIGIFTQAHEVTKQKQAEMALAELNDTLEARVAERNRELETLHETLRQSQKMEAIGNLAGGVAHDFNNLLQTITGSLQLASRELEAGSPVRGRLDLAMKAVDRGATLASQLLSFGRRQPLAPKVVNLGRLLEEARHILRSAVGEAVEIETEIARDLWNSCVDPANVDAAFLNMAINARDAMAGQGRLSIRLENVTLDADAAGRMGQLGAGDYVLLSFSDTGSGMSPEVSEKVFEPFFTTKEAEKGTGLGMSMVYGFVMQSKGHAAIDSAPGRGTTIRIYLPRSFDPVEPLPAPMGTALRGGSETILLVEDDADVRRVNAALLSDLGYQVAQAENADRAMEMIEQGLHIDLLFTDVVMPGTLSSREMAERAQRILPGLAVLFTSGFTQNSIVHGGRLEEGIHLLSKPYSQDKLAHKLRDTLARSGAGAGSGSASGAASGSGPETGGAAPPDTPPDGVPGAAASNGADTRRFEGLRVLLCEDDAIIRINLEEVLEMWGCDVLAAATGGEALSEAESGEVDLCVLDVGLPDMSGVDLARRIRSQRPGAALIFATGNNTLDGIEDLAPLRVLAKPFADEDLSRAIAMVMSGRGTAKD